MNKLPASVLLEAVLAIALLSLLSMGVLGVMVDGQISSYVAAENQRALQLAAEGLEGARALRNADFANLANTNSGVAVSGSSWQFQPSPSTTDGFTRTLNFTNIDTDTWRVDSQVEWSSLRGINRQVSLSTQLTNWLRAIAGWNNPNILSQADIAGSQDGIGLFHRGNFVYLLIAGGGTDFVVFDISNPASPITQGSLNVTGVVQDHYAIGDYVYVTSDRNNSELVVVDVSNPNVPVEVNNLNLPGNNDAKSIIGDDNNYIYFNRDLGAGNDFLIYDITNRVAPALVGGADLGTSNILGMVYDGGNIYAITDNPNGEVIVIDVSTPNTPSITQTYDLAGVNTLTALDYYNGQIYTGNTAGQIFVLDTTTVPQWTVEATYSYAGAGVVDLDYDESLNYLFVGTSGANSSLSILNLNFSPTITEEGSFLTAPEQLNAIVNDVINDLIYAASSDNGGELTIFAPT